MRVFLECVVVSPWQTNCYLVGAADGDECVVIDAGMGAETSVRSAAARHGRTPVAVLATHGHFDHVADAAELGLPVWIHSADRRMLADPSWGLAPQLDGFVGSCPEPSDVREFDGLASLALAGVEFELTHAPGHTPGGMLFRVAEADVLFSGDTLFAGSIGRTDFAVSDPAAMRRTLAGLLTLPDATTVLPGHGPRTTIGRERAANPFLRPGDLED